MELTAAVQRYEWGKVGSSSLVAKFSTTGESPIDPTGKYAELWMG
jgi:mannose-6-phosphate isomerase class I